MSPLKERTKLLFKKGFYSLGEHVFPYFELNKMLLKTERLDNGEKQFLVECYIFTVNGETPTPLGSVFKESDFKKLSLSSYQKQRYYNKYYSVMLFKMEQLLADLVTKNNELAEECRRLERRRDNADFETLADIKKVYKKMLGDNLEIPVDDDGLVIEQQPSRRRNSPMTVEEYFNNVMRS